MSSDYDATEFIDGDLHGQKAASSIAATAAGAGARGPTPEEVSSKVADAQRKLAELKRAQEELERQRASLEETRRRQAELQSGRQELIQGLTRGLGLLEEAEFDARRDAEQMAKSLTDLHDALVKVQAIHEEAWTKDNFEVELTRALTTLENARMEWNAARLKFAVLSGQPTAHSDGEPAGATAAPSLLGGRGFGELCRIGFALTWPLAIVGLVALGILVAILVRR